MSCRFRAYNGDPDRQFFDLEADAISQKAIHLLGERLVVGCRFHL